MEKYREKEEIRENEADKDKICGRNAVIEAIKSGREIDKIMVAKGATNLGKLYAMAKDAGIPVKEVAPVKIDELAAGANADKICREIEEIILDRPWDDDSVIASQIRYIYPHIFDWLDLLNMNVLIILILMIVVAGFNMISGLLIILFEKTSMIGLLKALGMKTRDICRVFIYRGSFIVIKGMVIGNVIAIILSILQGVFHIIPLDPANYFVDHVPVYVNVPKIVILNVASFALMILIMIIPSFFIARVQPEKTIKVS